MDRKSVLRVLVVSHRHIKTHHSFLFLFCYNSYDSIDNASEIMEALLRTHTHTHTHGAGESVGKSTHYYCRKYTRLT